MPATDQISKDKALEAETRTVGSQSLRRAGGAESARIGDTHDSDQDDGIENGGESLDASQLNGDDERRMTRCGALARVQLAVWRNNEANQGKVDDVEDGNAPDDLLGSPRDLLPRVLGLGGGQTSQLGAGVGEGGGDEDAAEAVEAIEEPGITEWLLAVGLRLAWLVGTS